MLFQTLDFLIYPVICHPNLFWHFESAFGNVEVDNCQRVTILAHNQDIKNWKIFRNVYKKFWAWNLPVDSFHFYFLFGFWTQKNNLEFSLESIILFWALRVLFRYFGLISISVFPTFLIFSTMTYVDEVFTYLRNIPFEQKANIKSKRFRKSLKISCFTSDILCSNQRKSESGNSFLFLKKLIEHFWSAPSQMNFGYLWCKLQSVTPILFNLGWRG